MIKLIKFSYLCSSFGHKRSLSNQSWNGYTLDGFRLLRLHFFRRIPSRYLDGCSSILGYVCWLSWNYSPWRTGHGTDEYYHNCTRTRKVWAHKSGSSKRVGNLASQTIIVSFFSAKKSEKCQTFKNCFQQNHTISDS